MCIKSLHYKAKLYVRVLRYLGTNVMGTTVLHVHVEYQNT